VSKRSSVLLIVAAFVAVSGAAMAHVSLRLGVVRMGYQIGELTRERRTLEEERRRYTTEHSMLKNPARIERLAREKLQMDLPDPSRIRTVLRGAPAVAVHDDPTASSRTARTR
jgi:cell division protein FtsL